MEWGGVEWCEGASCLLVYMYPTYLYITSYRSVLHRVLVTPITPSRLRQWDLTKVVVVGRVDAFVLLLGMVSPRGPPFSKIVESTSGLDSDTHRPGWNGWWLEAVCPWIVPHIGQDGMVDDWWQSAPGKIAAPPTLRWKSWGGGGSAAIFPVNMVIQATLHPHP